MLGSGLEFYLILVIFALPGIALGFTIHEYCHAAVATGFGDPLPRSQGRLSFNPANQVDPLGLLMLLVVGFGFARPVMYDPRRVRTGPQRAWLSFAGPVSNLVLAVVLGLALRLLSSADPAVTSCGWPSFSLPAMGFVYWMLVEAFYVNVIMLVFNLIPIPPLDGFGVAEGLLGERFPAPFHWMRAHQAAILVLLIVVVLLLPQLINGFEPLYLPLVTVFDGLWVHVVSGPPPEVYFPNITWLLTPGGSALANSLTHPCLVT